MSVILQNCSSTKDKTPMEFKDVVNNTAPFSLTSADLKGLTTVRDYALYGSTIQSIEFPDTLDDFDSTALMNCPNLSSITVDSNNTKYASEDNCLIEKDGFTINGVSYDPSIIKGCKATTKLYLTTVSSSNYSHYYVINTDAFRECAGLSNIELVLCICIKENAFKDCVDLEAIDIHRIAKVNGMYSIEPHAFTGCVNLRLIKGDNSTDTSSRIGYLGDIRTIAEQSGSTNYDIEWRSNGSTSFEGADHLSGLRNITLIDTSAGTNYHLVSIAGGTYTGALRGCYNLESVTLPGTITDIYSRALSGCVNLADIYFDGTVYVWNSINKVSGWDSNTGNYIIHCTNGIITKSGAVTYIPTPGLYYGLNQDGVSWSCTDAPDTVRDAVVASSYHGLPVTSIGGSAFNGCTDLTSITIPDSVISIGKLAFNSCTELTSIYFEGTVSQWGSITKGTYWNFNTGNYTIYCTDGNIPKGA